MSLDERDAQARVELQALQTQYQSATQIDATLKRLAIAIIEELLTAASPFGRLCISHTLRDNRYTLRWVNVAGPGILSNPFMTITIGTGKAMYADPYSVDHGTRYMDLLLTDAGLSRSTRFMLQPFYRALHNQSIYGINYLTTRPRIQNEVPVFVFGNTHVEINIKIHTDSFNDLKAL